MPSSIPRSKPRARLSCAAFLAIVLFGILGLSAQAETRTLFDANWRFHRNDPTNTGHELDYATVKDWVLPERNEFAEAGDPITQRPQGNLGQNIPCTQANYDDSNWRQLNLPHDWGVDGPFRQKYPSATGKLDWWGVGWYRKAFTIEKAPTNRQYFLDVDGAMAYSLVWLNGHFVGGWPYGYTSFRLNLTPYIKPGGRNVIAIRLYNPPASSRWYPGGGIYRHVWLVESSPVHVAHWGIALTTPFVSNAHGTVRETIRVINASGETVTATAHTKIYRQNRNGNPVGEVIADGTSLPFAIASGTPAQTTVETTVDQPRLWSPGTPQLYTAVTEISVHRKVVDTDHTQFGFRTIRFDPDRGLLVNGKVVQIKGVCDHHDLGPLGSALNDHALLRQLSLLKEMGCNAIRTSHNPPAPELLDDCDRLGIMVMDEAFDCWIKGKNKNDYHLLFPDWHVADFRALIRRDRNHPAVILWSIGNEVREQADGTEAIPIARELVKIAHHEDPTRPTTAAFNYIRSGYDGLEKIVDVMGYNYKPQEYSKFHATHPHIPLFGSETASTISSRGEYFFPVSNDRAAGRANFQVSSYDLYTPKWATTPDTEFRAQDANPFVAGEFVWTGFDYLGEPTPYNDDSAELLNFTDPATRARMAEELKRNGKIHVPSRSSYFGIFDLCGFKKDRFYLYQSKWRPNLPMAHILPHWNWPGRIGKVTPVQVYTSGDEAELFLNGKSLGRKKKAQGQYRLRWNHVIYHPGELRVVAYKDGKPWTQDVVRTTGPASAISLSPDQSRLNADSEDIAFVTVSIKDSTGLTVPTAENRLHFSISGPGRIVAIGNGNAASLEPFHGDDHNVFNGLCLVIVRPVRGKSGVITLSATGRGLKGTSVELTATRRPSEQNTYK